MPTRYCVRHGASGRGNAIRNWELRARERDTDGWTVLRAHYNDDAISGKTKKKREGREKREGVDCILMCLL